jgi:hypothetical protein
MGAVSLDNSGVKIALRLSLQGNPTHFSIHFYGWRHRTAVAGEYPQVSTPFDQEGLITSFKPSFMKCGM